MSDVPELLFDHHLKTLKLPTFLLQYAKLARQCAAENVEHVGYLKRLAELELIERERRMIERRLVWPRSGKHRAGSRPRGSRRRKVPLSAMLCIACRAMGQLRLCGDPVSQQASGHGAGALGVY